MYSDYGVDRLDCVMDQSGVVSCRASANLLCGRLSPGSKDGVDIYKKPRQEVHKSLEALSLLGVDESQAEFGSTDQNLEAQLQAESDSIDELEGMLQIRFMVLEAVWKGIVRAVEDEALRAVEVREVELLKLKQELQGKDSIIHDLSKALKRKDYGLAKTEESSHDELLYDVKEGMDVTTYRSEGRERSLGRLQGEVEQVDSEIQELTSAQLIPPIEDQHNQTAKEESTSRDSDRRCHMLLVIVKHLQDQNAVLNANLRESEEAAVLARAEMQEQNWKHEAEITVVVTILEGKMLDLERELSHSGEDIPTNQVETVISQSQVLQGLSSKLKNLRSSKATMLSRLDDTKAALISLETRMCAEQEKLEDKANELKYAESRTAILEQKLLEKERLLQNLQSEVAEMKTSGCNIQEQQKSPEVVEQVLRDELERKKVHFEIIVQSLEEQVWLVDSENMFISSYMESSFQDFQRRILEDMSVLKAKRRSLGSQCAPDGADMNRPGDEGAMSSVSGRGFQHSMKGNIQDISKAQAGSTEGTKELKGHEGHIQFEMLNKELEEKVHRGEKEVTKLQEALEESFWQGQVENLLVLGFGEGLCQRMTEIRQQMEKKSLDARNEDETKNRCVAVLEEEVSQLRDQIVLLKGELSSVNRTIKERFEGQLDTLMTSMQRLEGEFTGRVEQFISRSEQAHDTLRQMRKGFEGQIQSVMASIQRLEGDLAGEVEQFDSRLHQADYTLKQLSQQLRDREANNVQVFQDLKMAETEVDYLGDEVDTLMDLLEKVSD